jgi:4-amino-4-deoxy-L-arabinose transferase-like glycosyltransferase
VVVCWRLLWWQRAAGSLSSAGFQLIVKECVTVPALADAAGREANREIAWNSMAARSAFLLAAAGVVSMLVLNLFCREIYEGDEGFYGVTALNMLQSPDYILRPSYYPEGNFATEKNAYAHPPWNAHFYALTLWIGNRSLAGLEFLHAMFFAVFLYFAYRALKLFDAQAACFAVVLLAISPGIHWTYSQLEPEPLMAMLGMIALYCGLRGSFAPGQRKWLFLAGLSIGMAFAAKLWLCGPLALALAVALLARARRSGIREVLPGLLVFSAGVLITSTLHLLAVAYFYPEDLGFWLNNVYFGLFNNSGISATKFGAGKVPEGWVHPWWYYAAKLYRDHFFLWPIILIGGSSFLRDRRFNRELLWIIVAGAICLLPFSMMTVKEPQYILSCTIFLYFLAGACMAALVRRISERGEIDSFSRWFGTAAILGLLVLVPAAYALGIQPNRITGSFVMAHSIALPLFVAALWWAGRKRSFSLEWGFYAGCAVAVAAIFAHEWVTRLTRDKVVTRLMQPYVQSYPTRTLSFVASNFKAYQFTTFRRGCYWEQLPQQQPPEVVLGMPKFKELRVFVIDARDLRKGHLTHWLRWLEANATEKTREMDEQLGGSSGWRLFVREADYAGRFQRDQAR